MTQQEQQEQVSLSSQKEQKAEPRGDWYILRCLVGKEFEVKKKLEEKIASSENVRNKIFEVLVPEEEEIQIKKGEKIKVKKPVYKGYVYINMILDSESYSIVRSISGIKGFLGGTTPQKMSEKEVEEIKALMEKLKGTTPKVVRKFDVGSSVRIIDGPFRHVVGVVEEVNEEKGRLKVAITFFGRPTIVDLEFTQVEKV